MLSWFAPVLVFGLVVLVHELGHFMAAKLLGVYAPRFSIGFGRALWKRRHGETEYLIGWLPIGGYVRMASREDEAMAFLEGGSEVKVGAPRPGEALDYTALPDGVRRQGLRRDPGRALPRASGERSARADWDPNAMVPFGPRPVPPNRWFESKAVVGASDHSVCRRHDERGAHAGGVGGTLCGVRSTISPAGGGFGAGRTPGRSRRHDGGRQHRGGQRTAGEAGGRT